MTMRRTTWRSAAAVAAILAACSAATHAYVWGGYRWTTTEVPFFVNPANADISEDAALAAIQAGAAAWSTQTTANIRFVYAGYTSGSSLTLNYRNEVFFRNAENGSVVAETLRWFDGSGNLLDTDIVFYDGGWRFFTGTSGCSDGVYLEDFATHEFGHALGLKHSAVSTATMYPSTSRCSTAWRSLDPDDITGAEAIYPPATRNASPSVTIAAPASGTSTQEGTALAFSGSANDREDGNLSSQLVWTSSRDGQIGTGSAFSRVLSAGTHTITARVTDSAGGTSSTEVTVVVEEPVTNRPPAVSILTPASGTAFASGTAIAFSGAAGDPEDGALTATIVWKSSISGTLGVGGTITKALTAGNHTITASVTDSQGATASSQIAIAVAAPNTAPTAKISSPSAGQAFDTGSDVLFSGSAEDAEDGTLTSKMTWSSNIDGPLGMGGSFRRRLSAGEHTITASASDSGGATVTAAVTIAVKQAEAPLPAVVLTGRGYKIRGSQHADLSWTGAAWTIVDIYRDGALVGRTSNRGSYTDAVNKKGSGSSVYQVCEGGSTTVCSNQVLVRFE